jgi:methylated-DNA-[protein]-cysteine S-methyltransferase
MKETLCVKLFDETYFSFEVENKKVVGSKYLFEPIKEEYHTGFSKDLRDKIVKYSKGEPTNLQEVPIKIESEGFSKKVYNSLRKLPFGRTLTYGELAEISGSPGASRAVGNIMGNNSFPLFIPCHRVIASNGIGGFMKGKGIGIKYRLLELEKNSPAHHTGDPSNHLPNFTTST